MRSLSAVSRVAFTLAVLAGLVTVTLGVLDATRWSRGPASTVAPPVTVQALLEEGSQERHTLYAALRTEAPGARIVLDVVQPALVSELYLRTLGTAGAVERRVLPSGWVPEREPEASGALRDGRWALFAEPSTIDTVLIGVEGSRTVLVDLRSIPDTWQDRDSIGEFEVAAVPFPYRPQEPTLLRAVVTETLALVGLMLLGGLLLPRATVTGVARLPLALISGVAVQALTSYVFLVGRATLLIGPLAAAGVGLFLQRGGHRTGWTQWDLGGIAAATGAIAAVVAAVRISGSVIVQADAIQLMARAMAIAGGDLGLGDLDEKRPLAGSALQALGHALGIEGMQALGWVLLVASAAVIVLLPRLMGLSGRAGAAITVVAGLLVTALLINPLMAAIAKLVSTNTLVAALLLLLVVLWVRERPTDASSAIAPVGIIALLALIPTRAESVLIVGLVLIATLATREERLRWAWAWPAVGIGLLGWNGLHVVAMTLDGSRPSFPVAVLTAVGFLTVVIWPLLVRVGPAARSAAAWTAVGLLWGFVIAVALTPLGAGSRVFLGFAINIGEGAGAWGMFAPAVAAAALVGLVAHVRLADPRLALAAWIAFLALPSIVVSQSADGTDGLNLTDGESAISALFSAGTRLGSWGSSANRMWTHFATVIVALLIMVMISACQRGAAAPRRPVALVTAGSLSLVSVLVVLQAWSPAYLGPVAPETIRIVAERSEDIPGPELTRDTRIEQRLEVSRTALPADASDVQVCVEYRFTDLGRVNWGTTRFGLDGPDGRVSDSFGEMAWSGQRDRLVCLPAPDVDERPLPLVAWIDANARALPGSSAAVLVGADGDPVARVDVRYVAPSEDPRPRLMQVVSRSVRWAMQAGPALVTVLFAGSLALLIGRRADDDERDGARDGKGVAPPR